MLKHLVVAASLVCVQAASARAQQWQLVTPALTVTKTQLANGTRLDLVHRTGDHLTVEIRFLDRSVAGDQEQRSPAARFAGTADGRARNRCGVTGRARVPPDGAASHDADESNDGELIRSRTRCWPSCPGTRAPCRDTPTTCAAATVRPMTAYRANRSTSSASGRTCRAAPHSRARTRAGPIDSVDAIRIADDFVRCRAATTWYDVVTAWGCDAET